LMRRSHVRHLILKGEDGTDRIVSIRDL